MKWNQSRPGFELASPSPLHNGHLLLLIFPNTWRWSWMTAWFWQHVNPSMIILCLEFGELCSLNIYVFSCSWFLRVFSTQIGLVDRVFANGPGDWGSIPGRGVPKTIKIVLDTSLLNTQQYKVRIKGKEDQSKERSSALPNNLLHKLLKREPSGRPRLRSPTLLLLFSVV